MIRLTEVHIGRDAEALVLEVLRSGHLAQGEKVAAFEAAFAELAGSRHAVAVSSGTVALVATLQALGIGPGDEVVTTPFTFVATLNAILEVGATAVFVDVRPEDLTLDTSLLEGVLTARTRAILPVHLYGAPADMDGVVDAAAAVGAAVVEDAAQAHGATIEGRPVGSFGTGCFSLYATKNLTTGEGGMVTTSDDDLADRLRLLRSQGMRERYAYELPGHNYRMTDLQAAIGVAEIRRVHEMNALRRDHAAQLLERLAGCEGLVLPSCPPGREHVYHQFTIRVLAEAGTTRDELHQRLLALGIETGIYYPRVVFDYDCYRTHPAVRVTDVPVAAAAAGQVLSLPVHPWLSRNDIDAVADAVVSTLASTGQTARSGWSI